MASELWEIANVLDVAVGDVVVVDPSFQPVIIDRKFETGSIAINGGVRMWCERVFRRYTGPSPEELTRALELMARDLVSRAELCDEDIDEAFRSVCRDYMSMARLELEQGRSK